MFGRLDLLELAAEVALPMHKSPNRKSHPTCWSGFKIWAWGPWGEGVLAQAHQQPSGGCIPTNFGAMPHGAFA